MMGRNLFDDEDGVFDELTLQHWMKNMEECLEVRLAVSERYNDSDTLASHTSSRIPMTTIISAKMWK